MKKLTIADVTVDADLRALLPARSRQESEELRRQIREDGRVRNALVVWGPTNILIDGHGRLDEWKGLRAEGVEIPPPEIERNDRLPDLDAVKLWMIREQLGRRNLDPQAASLLRARLYKQIKESRTPSEHQNDAPKDVAGRKTSAIVAEQTGVSQATVERDVVFADALDLIGLVNGKAKFDIESGSLKLPKADVVAISKLPAEEMARALKDVRMGFDWRATKNGTPSREPGDDGVEADTAMLDAEGHDVTPAAAPAFGNLDRFKELDSFLRTVQSRIDELSRLPGGEQLRRFLQPTGSEEKQINKSEHLNALKRDVKHTRPHAVCPWCKGKGEKGCKGCTGTGWVTEMTWKNADETIRGRLK